MKISKFTTLAAALVMTGTLAGCSEAPTQALLEAETALSAVEEAGAAQYAPVSLTAANEAMAQLKAELAAQGEKMALMRRYGTAQELAAVARLSAETALAETQTAKQLAHDAAVIDLEAAGQLLEAVRPMLATAPRGKGSEADLRVMEADLLGVESALTEARADLAGGEFIAARAKAAAAQLSLGEIKEAVEAAQALKATAPRR